MCAFLAPKISVYAVHKYQQKPQQNFCQNPIMFYQGQKRYVYITFSPVLQYQAGSLQI